jgi:hypothetical protein
VAGETIIPRPAEVERALREMAASYPTLRRTWTSAAAWAQIDALSQCCEEIERMLGW